MNTPSPSMNTYLPLHLKYPVNHITGITGLVHFTPYLPHSSPPLFNIVALPTTSSHVFLVIIQTYWYLIHARYFSLVLTCFYLLLVTTSLLKPQGLKCRAINYTLMTIWYLHHSFITKQPNFPLVKNVTPPSLEPKGLKCSVIKHAHVIILP